MKKVIQSFALVGVCCIGGCTSTQPKHLTAEEIIKIQQAQGTTTNATGAVLAPTPRAPAPLVEQFYPNEHMEHWVAIVLDRGARVKLEDGSQWEIARAYQAQTMFWLVSEKITVERNPDPEHPFKLLNAAKRNAVSARLVAVR